MTERRRGAAVGARRIDDRPQRAGLVAGAAFLILAAFSVAARAETVITAHGISTFGDLKYPAGFAHLDYVNPDAQRAARFRNGPLAGSIR